MATSKAIIDRILSANQNAPHIASMDFVASLRVRRPLSAPPDCVFEGAVKLQEGHRSATVNHLTPGLLCFAINRTIISKLFEGNEPFATLLARFDFQVLGEKLADGDQYYLVQGKARESQADPKAMIGWIDYNRGLVIEATMHYAVRAIDLAQHYASINSAWVLTYQYVDIPSLGSTLEISYSKVTLEPAPASREPAEKYRLHRARFSLSLPTMETLRGGTTLELPHCGQRNGATHEVRSAGAPSRMPVHWDCLQPRWTIIGGRHA